MKQANLFIKIVYCLFILTLVFSGIDKAIAQGNPPGVVAASGLYGLPLPTKMVPLSPVHSEPLLKGIKIDPNDPFKFEFILDKKGKVNIDEAELRRLVEYFLTAVTVSSDDLWVNLSPNEPDRVMPENVSYTEFGKGLLAQDYVLKQLTSSITYPDSELGKAYWDKIYQEVYRLAGTTKVPVNTFNKVWITTREANVIEDGNIAIITNSAFKVLSEQDYQAILKNSPKVKPTNIDSAIANLTSQVMKEVVLPKIEQDVNYGANFATLRQMHNSFILAVWFKKKLKDSIYQNYINKGKIAGVDLADRNAKDKIYNLYIEAFKKGVFDYIKKDYDKNSGKYLSRRYYSGGIQPDANAVKITTGEADAVLDRFSDKARLGVVLGSRRNGTEFGNIDKFLDLPGRNGIEGFMGNVNNRNTYNVANIISAIEQREKSIPDTEFNADIKKEILSYILSRLSDPEIARKFNENGVVVLGQKTLSGNFSGKDVYTFFDVYANFDNSFKVVHLMGSYEWLLVDSRLLLNKNNNFDAVDKLVLSILNDLKTDNYDGDIDLLSQLGKADNKNGSFNLSDSSVKVHNDGVSALFKLFGWSVVIVDDSYYSYRRHVTVSNGEFYTEWQMAAGNNGSLSYINNARMTTEDNEESISQGQRLAWLAAASKKTPNYTLNQWLQQKYYHGYFYEGLSDKKDIDIVIMTDKHLPHMPARKTAWHNYNDNFNGTGRGRLTIVVKDGVEKEIENVLALLRKNSNNRVVVPNITEELILSKVISHEIRETIMQIRLLEKSIKDYSRIAHSLISQLERQEFLNDVLQGQGMYYGLDLKRAIYFYDAYMLYLMSFRNNSEWLERMQQENPQENRDKQHGWLEYLTASEKQIATAESVLDYEKRVYKHITNGGVNFNESMINVSGSGSFFNITPSIKAQFDRLQGLEIKSITQDDNVKLMFTK